MGVYPRLRTTQKEAPLRNSRALAAAGVAALIATGSLFQACGGGTVTIDAGADGDVPPTSDVFVPPQDDVVVPPMNDGSTDGAMEAGPTCTATPCIVGLGIGSRHNCAVVGDGTLRCWGDNTYGQLGLGPDAGTATQSVGLPVPGITNATQVSASSTYNGIGTTCARAADGGALCWGNNSYGQLGLDADSGVFDNGPHPAPSLVQGISGATMVSTNTYHSCAVSGGAVYCWGSRGSGMLGGGTSGNTVSPPAQALIDASASQAWAGNQFTLVVMGDGTMRSFGTNTDGQLGRLTGNQFDAMPGQVTNLTGVTQASAGYQHACAVTGQGALYCWGANDFGQLGLGMSSGQPVTLPAQVTLPMGKQAKQVSCGSYHSCALMTDGTVYCFGRNNTGQSGHFYGGDGGDGGYDPTPATSPTLIALPAKATAVGAGGPPGGGGGVFPAGHACALLEGGAVQCWGSNGASVLGRGDAGVDVCFNGAPCGLKPANVVFQ
jgi:alpha-tubulin suppressor-like RCC1 family protein